MSNKKGRRGNTSTAKSLQDLPALWSPPRSVFQPARALPEAEDRRFFTPSPTNALSLSGKPHRLRLPSRTARRTQTGFSIPTASPAIQVFDVPDTVAVCVRRKRRREVLHALRKTGKAGQRRPMRNWFSTVSCRR